MLTFSSLLPSAARAEGEADWKILAQDKGHAVVLNAKGEVEWEVPVKHTSHDIALLPNGNYPAAHERHHDRGNDAGQEDRLEARIQAHRPATRACRFTPSSACPTATRWSSESGNARIIEVDKDDKIVKEFPLTVEHPSTHSDTRLVRKLDNGHYLVAHENDGTVREYDENGKVVWSYKLDLAGRPASPGHGPEGHGDHVYSAYRLPNGNTLIGGGNNNRVIEVTPEGKTVWSIDQKELPGITLAWVTMLEVLPNGNIVIGNCHAGPENPQLIEVTRDKKVVWTFKDFKNLGNSTAATQVLGVGGKVIR